ncbi:MAG: hypothetical protein B7Y39_11645 [Bdellovibrio sp. 28-41-41]|nr:MAG: hypothetical protein B7Y39_11645 [Bdellovibrio sp. 28-41-41]
MDFVIYLFLFHAVMWIFSGVILIFDRNIDDKRKVYQLLFGLVVPLLGPVVVIVMNIGMRLKNTKPSDRYIGQSINENPYIPD